MKLDPRLYLFMLNSTKHELYLSHKYKKLAFYIYEQGKKQYLRVSKQDINFISQQFSF